MLPQGGLQCRPHTASHQTQDQTLSKAKRSALMGPMFQNHWSKRKASQAANRVKCGCWVGSRCEGTQSKGDHRSQKKAERGEREGSRGQDSGRWSRHMEHDFRHPTLPQCCRTSTSQVLGVTGMGHHAQLSLLFIFNSKVFTVYNLTIMSP